jgi:hypothetical protein
MFRSSCSSFFFAVGACSIGVMQFLFQDVPFCFSILLNIVAYKRVRPSWKTKYSILTIEGPIEYVKLWINQRALPAGANYAKIPKLDTIYSFCTHTPRLSSMLIEQAKNNDQATKS